jgi:uncharacterized membrane protein YvlD (DUF360 family)
MRALTSREMALVFRVTRSCFLGGGALLVVFGLWYIVTPILYHLSNPLLTIGIFPAYIGGMLILVGAAMKEDWFTAARRYW